MFLGWCCYFLLVLTGDRLFWFLGDSRSKFLSIRLQSSYLKAATLRLGISLSALTFLSPDIVLLFVMYCQGVDTRSLWVTVEEFKRSCPLSVFVSEPWKKLLVVRFIIYCRYRIVESICIIFIKLNRFKWANRAPSRVSAAQMTPSKILEAMKLPLIPKRCLTSTHYSMLLFQMNSNWNSWKHYTSTMSRLTSLRKRSAIKVQSSRPWSC